MNYEDLSLELLEKAKACKTPEELFTLAKEEGVELSEDEVAAISGGQLPSVSGPFVDYQCPRHQSGWRG